MILIQNDEISIETDGDLEKVIKKYGKTHLELGYSNINQYLNDLIRSDVLRIGERNIEDNNCFY